MQYRYSPLQQDAECPYCLTAVPAGASVCAACGAGHVVRRRIVGMAVGFFLVGLFVGYTTAPESMLLIALGVAAVGAYAVNWSDSRRPFWLRVSG